MLDFRLQIAFATLTTALTIDLIIATLRRSMVDIRGRRVEKIALNMWL